MKFAEKTAWLLSLLFMFSSAASVVQARGGGGMSHSAFNGPSKMPSTTFKTLPVFGKLPSGSLKPVSQPTGIDKLPPVYGQLPSGSLKPISPVRGTTNLPPIFSKLPPGTLKPISLPTGTNHLPPVFSKLPPGAFKPIGFPPTTTSLPPVFSKLPPGAFKPIVFGPVKTPPTQNPPTHNPPRTGSGSGFGLAGLSSLLGGFGGFGGSGGDGGNGSADASGSTDSPAPMAATPAAAAADETPDLQVVAIEAVDSGDATDLIGPRYRVTIHNAGSIGVDQDFTVSLSASGQQASGGQSLSNSRKVTGLAAGETKQVDIRLPYGVTQMASDAQGHSTSLYLTATADSDQQVNDANRSNNIASVMQQAEAPTRVASAQ